MKCETFQQSTEEILPSPKKWQWCRIIWTKTQRKVKHSRYTCFLCTEQPPTAKHNAGSTDAISPATALRPSNPSHWLFVPCLSPVFFWPNAHTGLKCLLPNFLNPNAGTCAKQCQWDKLKGQNEPQFSNGTNTHTHRNHKSEFPPPLRTAPSPQCFNSKYKLWQFHVQINLHTHTRTHTHTHTHTY